MSHDSRADQKRGLKDRYAAFREKIRGHFLVSRKHQQRIIENVAAQFVPINIHLVHLNSQIAHAISRIAVPDYLLALPGLASMAKIAAKTPIDVADRKEVCFFVSHAPDPELKPHVANHLRALLDQRIAVVLIVNTEHSAESFRIDDGLARRLSGCLIRENVGFDFAAWSHAYALSRLPADCARLYLINDSIVGPFDDAAYAKMLARIRASSADLVGPTENRCPEHHLQSYYLTINQRLLHSETFARFMRGVVNLPTKLEVIAHYETQITRYFCKQGFSFAALYPLVQASDYLSDPTLHGWRELIEAGFPFVKTRILTELPPTQDVERWIPRNFLQR